MFLTIAGIAAAIGVLGNGILAVCERYRPREFWEPTFREMLEFRESKWKLVAELPIAKTMILSVSEGHDLAKLDQYIWKNLAAQAGIDPKTWTQWTIDWRHGCIGPAGERLEAGWDRPDQDTYAMVYFYDSTPVAPPKPAPKPEPEPINLWTKEAELQQNLSYLRSPSGFWLKPTEQVVLRFYADGRIVDAKEGASVSGVHADLVYDPDKKIAFTVTTDDAEDGWKQKRYRSMATAEAAITKYFKKRATPVITKKGWPGPVIWEAGVAVKDARSPVRIVGEAGVSAKDMQSGLNSFAKALAKPSQIIGYQASGNMSLDTYYTFSTDEKDYHFTSLTDAIKGMAALGHSMTEIAEIIGYGGKFGGNLPNILAKPRGEFMDPNAEEISECGTSYYEKKTAIKFTAHDLKQNRHKERLRGERVMAYTHDHDGGMTFYMNERDFSK